MIEQNLRRSPCAAVLPPVRRTTLRHALATLLCAVAGAALGGCRVDDPAFQSRVFRCDTSAADPLCGTDAAGSALQCFAARQIGATDFCAQQCGDLPMSLPDEGAVCVQGNAKLKSCNPADGADPIGHPDGACDRPEFGCLRTNVLPTANAGPDEGVCLTMKTCSQNSDCRDPVRSVCAATFLKQLYAGAGPGVMHADSLYCLQQGCDKDATSCSPGESCLRKVLPIANPPDICVPNCDSNNHCPPNHFCLQAISGPANPAVCIPGLLGFVCNTDVDCLVGTCLDDLGTTGRVDGGDNLKLCTMSCASDKDCSKFDSQQGLFTCNLNHRCATPNAYQGATCKTDDDCVRDRDSRCMRSNPGDAEGTCLHACAADGSCPPRGGINQTCFPLSGQDGPVPICFPGFFGLPCFSDDNCVGDLSCRGADLKTNPPTPGLCTALCGSDHDCATDRWTLGGKCALPEAPICVPPPGVVGATCFLNAMCTSGFCDLTTLSCAEPTQR